MQAFPYILPLAAHGVDQCVLFDLFAYLFATICYCTIFSGNPLSEAKTQRKTTGTWEKWPKLGWRHMHIQIHGQEQGKKYEIIEEAGYRVERQIFQCFWVHLLFVINLLLDLFSRALAHVAFVKIYSTHDFLYSMFETCANKYQTKTYSTESLQAVRKAWTSSIISIYVGWTQPLYIPLPYMSNCQNSRILRYVLAGHWFSESAKNWG